MPKDDSFAIKVKVRLTLIQTYIICLNIMFGLGR